MTLAEFRTAVRREFGRDLEHMTPANVREFLDRIQEREAPVGERIHLDEPARSYESILKDFFRQVLEIPPEQAIIPLWLLAVELAFADLREHLAPQLERLFVQMGASGDE
ncbi:MAG: hypothetical protein HY320_15000 [Armatimonadetes bacterium]|nr:hypothetical protein [Armatimonadota bacterium]